MEIVIIAAVALVVLYILFRIFKAFVKWGIIIIVLILVLAYFTNPKESFHVERLKDTAKNLSIKKIREKFIKVDDYKVFSLVKVKVDGEDKTVGIGAFGKVWYFDDIKEKLKDR